MIVEDASRNVEQHRELNNREHDIQKSQRITRNDIKQHAAASPKADAEEKQGKANERGGTRRNKGAAQSRIGLGLENSPSVAL